jgi:hypothetical protein
MRLGGMAKPARASILRDGRATARPLRMRSDAASNHHFILRDRAAPQEEVDSESEASSRPWPRIGSLMPSVLKAAKKAAWL